MSSNWETEKKHRAKYSSKCVACGKVIREGEENYTISIGNGKYRTYNHIHERCYHFIYLGEFAKGKMEVTFGEQQLKDAEPAVKAKYCNKENCSICDSCTYSIYNCPTLERLGVAIR